MPSALTTVIWATMFTLGSPLLAVEPDVEGFLGAWAFELPDGNPAWLKISKDGDQLQGSLLWSVGSARPIRSIQFENGVLSFDRKIKWRPYGEAVVKSITRPLQAKLKDGKLQLILTQTTEDPDSTGEDEQIQLMGRRIPPPPPKPDLSDVAFGKSIELFNGQDLTGWKLSNPKKRAYLTKEFLVQQKIGNALVEGIKESDIEG